MKTSKAAVTLAVILCGVFAAESAFAWGRSRVRVGFGFYFGAPVAAFPYYYPPPYYYYPPYYPTTVVMPAQPTVYVEQGAQSAPPQPASYWYYCPDTRAYYPYVRNCMSGWRRVAPQPG